MSTFLPESRVGGPASLAHPLRTGAVVFVLAAGLAAVTVPVLTSRISTTIVARGRLVPSLGILEIRSLRPGRIASVLVREGQIVQRGQTLARIDVGEADVLGGSRRPSPAGIALCDSIHIAGEGAHAGSSESVRKTIEKVRLGHHVVHVDPTVGVDGI